MYLFFLLLGLVSLKASSRVDNVSEAYNKITQFLENPTKSNEMLDDILKSGGMGGFYTAFDFYQIISYLHIDYPDYLTDLQRVGRTFQNREIQSYRIGDLSKLIRG